MELPTLFLLMMGSMTCIGQWRSYVMTGEGHGIPKQLNKYHTMPMLHYPYFILVVNVDFKLQIEVACLNMLTTRGKKEPQPLCQHEFIVYWL